MTYTEEFVSKLDFQEFISIFGDSYLDAIPVEKRLKKVNPKDLKKVFTSLDLKEAYTLQDLKEAYTPQELKTVFLNFQ